MRSVSVAHQADFAGWRDQARRLLATEIPPQAVIWTVAAEQQSLFAPAADGAPPTDAPGPTLMVPRGFMPLAESVVQHRDPERFALAYRLLWRLTHGERGILQVAVDADVHRMEMLAKAVHRDTHKMRAFLRFRTVEHEGQEHYLAWFEPDHFIVEANAAFFVRRFAGMCWSIMTPYRTAHWDTATLRFGPGASRRDVPAEDELETYWRTYYASIFNPARLNPVAMRSEMPKKYWHNLPEAQIIAPLIQAAAGRTNTMLASSATEPGRRGRVLRDAVVSAVEVDVTKISSLRKQVLSCRECPLWENATQAVFGEGAKDAPVMLVGEQPGDQEDLAGRPFVGPAGQMLDRALAEAGVDRSRTYVTNAVKHFKFVPRGKRRLHQKPDAGEINACHHWLAREIDLVEPHLVVALGATAVQSLFGRPMKIGEVRGKLMPLGERRALVTVHPSYLLRLPDPAVKEAEYRRFVADLRLAADSMAA